MSRLGLSTGTTLAAAALLLAACTQPEAPSPARTSTPDVAVASPSPAPTLTAAPTRLPQTVPTATPTSEPTSTPTPVPEPTPTGVRKLTASDGTADDSFGGAVSLSGNRAVVGTWGDDDQGDWSGSAYVFERDGTGAWLQARKLIASDGAADDLFGISVSISGDRAVVGAYRDDDAGRNSGSAYVFERDGTGMWDQVQKLTASDGAADDDFGILVSISGERAVVGAPGHDGKGSAYVFERDGTGTWLEVQELIASDGAVDDGFGLSVSISGDRAVVAAPGDDDAGSASGSAYVFERDGTGAWFQVQKLTASDGAVDDIFGWSVSIIGDRAVVGTPGDDDTGSASGSAYVFERDGTGAWSQAGKLTGSDGPAGSLFGHSVSISGDTVVVGAPFDGAGGSAYVFERDATGTWSQVRKLTVSDGAIFDVFGVSVSISGGMAVVGARNDDDEGSAYVFERDGAGTWQ